MATTRNLLQALGTAALVLAAAPAWSASIPDGPAGTDFYVAPSPLPDGPHGSAIWTRALSGTMALPSAARNELLLYSSTDPKGQPVAVSGTVSIPQGTAPEGGWPVIVWTHGTTGLAPACAPSLDTADGPEHGYVADTATLLDGFVKQGYAIVATDYQGLGTKGPHPFLQGIPNGRNAIDTLVAARALEPSLGKRYAVVGHSQGGHADLFAASLGPDYAPDLTLVGNAAFAPGSHVAERLAAVAASPKFELALPYVLYVMESYAADYPEIDLAKILTPTAISHLPDLLDGCMSHALTTGYWSTAIAKDQFLPNADVSALLKVASANEPGTVKIAEPTLVLQGKADVTVTPDTTDKTVAELCANGNNVQYNVYPGIDHDGVMVAGADDAAAWLKARFAGAKATSNCDSLPSAGTP